MKPSFRLFLYAAVTFLLFQIRFGLGQPILKPSIGLSELPKDQDSICPIVFNIDTAFRYEATGLQDGDTIPEFILYSVNDEKVDIASVLSSGKPTLLIGGSYTCPVFRQKREKINQLAAMYGDRVNIFVVYTEEAHPKAPDFSPNSGNVWTLDVNIKKNILYAQPRTYGDRRKTAKEMLAVRELKVPLLLDGPCNQWWTTFGVAPNSAFLIAPSGILVHKQGWLNGGSAPMSFYIDSLLNDINKSPSVRSQNKVTVDQSTDSTLKFLLAQSVENANITIYDQYGRNPYGTVSFSGKEYVMDATRFSPGNFLYEIKNGEETIIGHFPVTRKKEVSGESTGSR